MPIRISCDRRSSPNCATGWNTLLIPAYDPNNPANPNPEGKTADLNRQNSEHYTHYLRHEYGLACVVPGPDVADFLLRPGGALDDTGAGTLSLAMGNTVTSTSTCIGGPEEWCGTITITPQLLVAVYWNYLGLSPIDIIRALRKPIPPGGVERFWYGTDSGAYSFRVLSMGTWWFNYPFTDPCGASIPGQSAAPVHRIIGTSKTNICGAGTWGANYGTQGGYLFNESSGNFLGPGLSTGFGQFRGVDNANPGAPPTLEEAKPWVQRQINEGHWDDGTSLAVKPKVDAVIRSAQSPEDLKPLGISGNPGNSFDGMRWIFP